jgi:hypothetical protein
MPMRVTRSIALPRIESVSAVYRPLAKWSTAKQDGRQLQPQEAPTELILRHKEIKFIVCSPEFRRVVEMWREMCGLTRAAGNQAARGGTDWGQP